MTISAGGTREPLDPVRFLGNRSSGKQGVALAVAARDAGATVRLLAAHMEVPARRASKSSGWRRPCSCGRPRCTRQPIPTS